MPYTPTSIVRLLYGEGTVKEKRCHRFLWQPSARPSAASDSTLAGSSEFVAHSLSKYCAELLTSDNR
jgi:hypothetical protein